MFLKGVILSSTLLTLGKRVTKANYQ